MKNIIIILCAIFWVQSTSSQQITGTATMELLKPANKYLKSQQRIIAQDSLSNTLQHWIMDMFNGSFDTTNKVSQHYLDIFIESCLNHTTERSVVNGREWKLTLEIEPHTIDSIIAAYNAHYDSLAINYWKLTQEGIKHNRTPVIFNAGIKALYYAQAHIGNPIIEDDKEIFKELHTLLQNIINKIDISFDVPVVAGRPPEHPTITCEAIVSIDTIPLTNFPIELSLPNGRKLSTLITNSEGSASLKYFSIPFVATGTFLHVKPDFAAIVDPELNLTAKAFGFKLHEEKNDQTLIFKITQPLYTINYNAASVSDVVLPSSFSTSTSFEKYLKDSLQMAPANGKKADLNFIIQCQISKYSFDEQEETQLKAEAQIIVEHQSTKNRQEINVILNDKIYPQNHDIPIGLFFWEANVALKNAARNQLDKL